MVVGTAAERNHRPGRATIWRPVAGGGYDKQVVGPGDEHTESTFLDVNDQDQAVGYAVDENGRQYAIVFDGSLIDLNQRVPVEGVHFLEARAINGRGDIAGAAEVEGRRRGFLLREPLVLP